MVGGWLGGGVGEGGGGHAPLLQLSELAPMHCAPPFWGVGLLHSRVFTPSPHVRSHGPHADQPPSTGHGVWGHVTEESPEHPEPCRGDGLVQVRVLIPLSPQSALHVDHSDQPPSLHSRVSDRSELPSSPTQSAPQVDELAFPSVPVWHWLGSGLLHDLVWTLPEHDPHADQPPSTTTWQSAVPQSLVVAPTQSAPPLEGTGLLQTRDCVPPPHVAVHSLQSLNPPSMACVAPRHASLQCDSGQFGGLYAQLVWHHASYAEYVPLHSPAEHAPVLQLCDVAPEQSEPPLLGAGFVQERVWVPPPQVTLHADHAVHPPFTGGQAATLHAWVLSPAQSLPPFAGAGLLQVRVCVPPPQSLSQTLHADQPPLTGVAQLIWLHACWLSPAHCAPPLAGVGLLQVRVCVPPPQSALHGLQLDQPPLTGPSGGSMHSVMVTIS